MGCDFPPFCADALWLVYCDGMDEYWLSCDTDCQDMGFSKGLCDLGACICG